MRPGREPDHRVLLVDDHTILREGVRALLHDEPDLAVVGEAGDGQEALEQVARAATPTSWSWTWSCRA